MTTEHVSVPREFIEELVKKWKQECMAFADMPDGIPVPKRLYLWNRVADLEAILSRATSSYDKPSAPREATDAPSFEQWYWAQIQNPLATAYNNPLGIPTDGNLHDAAKWGWDACRKSFATSLPAARVPDGLADELLDAWRNIAHVSGSALLSGEKKAQTSEQRELVYGMACNALISIGNAYYELTGKNPDFAAAPQAERKG